MNTQKTIKVALADDHILLRDPLAALVDTFEGCRVIFTAANGREVQTEIERNGPPDVMIMDLNMPEMNGFEATCWLKQHYPAVLVLILSMYDTDLTLIRLLKAGAKGFLKKDAHPRELELAIRQVKQYGYYYAQSSTGKMADLLRDPFSSDMVNKNRLSDQEIEFITLCCSDLAYKEIAKKMKLSPRAVDTLRNNLFSRLNVKGRVALAVYAMRHGLIVP